MRHSMFISAKIHRFRSAPGVVALSVITLAMGLLLALNPPAAHAVDPTLKTLVGIVATALGEPALNDALPLIDCVRKSGPVACVNVKGLAEAEGKKAAKQFTPNDPLIQAAVEIIKAAYAEDWIKVLELTGTDILVQITCKAGLSGGGPLKGFICGGAFPKVSKMAKPVVKQVLVAVKNPTPGNLLGLIAVMDPGLACEVVPGFPGKDEICGSLGEVIKLAEKVGKEAAKAGKKAGEFLLQTGDAIAKGLTSAGEFICDDILGICDSDSGKKKLMSLNEYYKYRLFPLVHDRVVARLTKGQQYLGHDSASKQACLEYYGYGYYYALEGTYLYDQIAQSCDKVGKRLHDEANVLAQAFAAAPGPYFESAVKPLLATFSVEGYGQNKATGYAKFVTTGCVTYMRKTFPIVEPTQQGGLTAWSLTCAKVASQFKLAYAQEEQKLAAILQKLVATGCFPPKGWVASQGIKLECDSYPGYQQCLGSLSAGHEKEHCSVNQKKADKKLPNEIVQQLGKKRCQVSGADVACTRPWKRDECAAALAKAKQMAPAASLVNVQCLTKDQLKDEPAFSVVAKQAQDILNTLNGVKYMGVVKKPGGKTEGMVLALPAVCSHTFDPLSITCDGNPKAPAQMGVKLVACAPDPNQDGADAPCYAGPYSASGGPTTAKAVAVLPGGAPPKPATETTDKPSASRRAKAPMSERSGGFAPLPAAGPVMLGQPKGLPDITSGTGVVIGGKSAPWGSSVTVDVKSAHSVNMNNSGLCEFAVKHTARNIGLASTGPFGSVWKTSNVPSSGREWLPIAAGGSKEETDLVRLKPGQNLLHLTLDDLGKVQESNEGNNRFRIIVNVAGICGPKPGIVPPPAGGLAPKAGVRTLSQPPGPPISPPPPAGGEQSGAPASPRLPAVQQKAN